MYQLRQYSALCCFLGLVFFTRPAYSQAEIHGNFDISTILPIYFYEKQLGLGFAGTADLQIESAEQNLKVELALALLPIYIQDVTASKPYSTVPISLKRLAIKARIPLSENYKIRISFGKTRLSWGEGFIFNAGDLLFGSANPISNLQAENIRDSTGWLAALYFPLGQFSFLEFLAMAPNWEDTTRPKFIYQSSFGGRAFLQLGPIKLEGGYLYNGETSLLSSLEKLRSHRTYLGIKTAFGDLNWYLQLGYTLPLAANDELAWESSKKYLNASLGLRLQANIASTTLLLRLEALVAPLADWTAQEALSRPVYALFIYPEISVSTSYITWLLRAVLSPIDMSATITTGLQWRAYQSFYFYLYLNSNIGEDHDLFAFKSAAASTRMQAGLSTSIGLRYSF